MLIQARCYIVLQHADTLGLILEEDGQLGMIDNNASENSRYDQTGIRPVKANANEDAAAVLVQRLEE